MKKFILAFALLVGIASFNNNNIEAKNINVIINIDRQPAWGPIGYDYVDYYYFPEINCYYGVNTGLYHYYDRGRWYSAHYLPYGYSHYDLYGMYKVVLNVSKPWKHNRIHVRDYRHYVGHRNQLIIRDSRDHRYHTSRSNRYSWYSDSHKHSHSAYKGKNNSYNKPNRYDRDNSYNKPNRNDRDNSYNKPNRNDRNNNRYSHNKENSDRERATVGSSRSSSKGGRR